MKNIKYILAALAAGAMLFACSEEEKYTAGDPEQENTYDVYFPDQTVTEYELDPNDETASTVTITVKRANTSGAITVPITIEQVPDTTAFVFTHTDVTFADGEDETTFQVSFPDALVGLEYICHILVDDPAYAKVYTYDETQPAFYSFSFKKVSWSKVCTGTYTSSYFGANEGVELQQCDQNPTAFRLINPFKYGTGATIVFNLVGKEQKDDDGYAYYNCSLDAQYTGYDHPSYGAVYIEDVATWQDYSAYQANNSYYPEDGYTQVWAAYMVSLGCINYGYDTFVPATE